MDIQTVINKYNLNPLYLENPNKEYAFTTVLDNALKLKKDFIFIPFATNTDSVYDLILQAFATPYCKGFILNSSALENANFKPRFHSLMKNCSYKSEVILLAQNIYNFANSMTLENSQRYDFETISIVGTQETSTIVQMLVHNLKEKKISYSNDNWNCWQKIFEPLLFCDEETEFAILEAVPEKLNLTGFVSNFKNNNIIFSKSSLYNMRLYTDLEQLSDELIKSLKISDNILSITTLEDNELVNPKISYKYQTRLNIVTESSNREFSQDIYYLNRCSELVESFLNKKGLTVQPWNDFIETFPLYQTKNNKGVDYLILNKYKLSVDTITKSLKTFFKLYENKRKVVILEHILNLGNYKETVYANLMRDIALHNPDILILLNSSAYTHLFKRFNKKTYVQSIQYTSDNQKSISDFNRFVKSTLPGNCAVYIVSAQDLSELYAEDK